MYSFIYFILFVLKFMSRVLEIGGKNREGYIFENKKQLFES